MMSRQTPDSLDWGIDAGKFPNWPHTFAVTGLLLLAALASLRFDIPVARWALAGGCPRTIHECLEIGEGFGHGAGVAIIVAAAWLLDMAGRRRIVRIVATVLAAGLSADLVKLFVGRLRPRDFSFAHGHVIDTFVTWLPLAGNHSGGQGFPSAHTATAVALALALSWAYPRSRSLVFTLAAMVAIQRVECGAHFASDALAGAAIGWLAGSYMLCPDALFGGLHWLEARVARCLKPVTSEADLSVERPPADHSRHRRRAAEAA
jgi:undecaprenyl-diphosphatase